MTNQLQVIQTSIGAVFESDSPVPTSFGNEATAVQAAHQSVALSDRSHWGRLQVSGSDRQNFLHNQSTNDFKSLKPGQGCNTVFVTSTARTIDLATAYILEDQVLVLVSPNRREKLLTWLDRYIFFGDNVVLTDVTAQTAMFSLIGPQSSIVLQTLGLSMTTDAPANSHALVEWSGHSVRVAVGCGLTIAGYTLIMPCEVAADLWHAIAQAGALPLGDRAWEQLRIEQGRPAPDRELTEDYNPLEAGLWQAVSFNKGCYIGQETIARLDTYKGVKQQLWGIRLNATAAPGSVITLENEKIGLLTSLVETTSDPIGLAYIRTKAVREGLKVQVGDREGELVSVPFLEHRQ